MSLQYESISVSKRQKCQEMHPGECKQVGMVKMCIILESNVKYCFAVTKSTGNPTSDRPQGCIITLNDTLFRPAAIYTPNDDLIIELSLFQGFHRGFAKGVVCDHWALIQLDTWFSIVLDLHMFYL